MPQVGYSGTPLLKKLGFKAPGRVWLHAPPESYCAWLGALPDGLELRAERGIDALFAAHLFVDQRAELERLLLQLRQELEPGGFIWVSWPKRSSGAPTDITEDTIRELALPLGFVDIKVCAVSEIWSGLKLVIRKSLRCSGRLQ
jgi:hypothetical protein